MRTNVIVCLAGALIGAVVSIALWDQPHSPLKVAADQPPLPGPQGQTFQTDPGPTFVPGQQFSAPPPSSPVPTTPLPAPVGQPVAVPPSPVPDVSTRANVVPAAPNLQNNTPLPMVVRGRLNDDDLTPDERVNVAVYDNVNRSVVNITTEIHERTLIIETNEEGTGSGSVLDGRGNILTNFHVIEGASEINVTLYDGSQHKATIVGRDATSDIAVLHIDASPDTLYPVRLGDSTHLRVGQRVFAIGNPFGLERTLTTGIISSLDRTIPSRNNHRITSVIQTDAAINPGNSGGPLLDAHGRLIGMNTAIASRTGQSAGIGFAIPVSIIAHVVPQLIDSPLHRVLHPDTGIAAHMYETESGRGLYVVTLAKGGPGELAGLRGFKVINERKQQGFFTVQTRRIDASSADMIVGVDNQKVSNLDDFNSAIDNHQPGDVVQLHIIRDNREVVVPLRLGTADS